MSGDMEELLEVLVHRARTLTYGMLERVKRPPDYADFRAAFREELEAYQNERVQG